MKRITLFLLSICILTFANAQSTKGSAKRTLKKVMEIEMPGEDGSNGGSVAYNPSAKKYYIPMLGNEVYPFAIFDSKGKLITYNEAGNDIRGLWYNPKTKQLEGNCYADGGWIKYKLNNKAEIEPSNGIYDSEKIFTEKKQPDEQSVGFYSGKEDLVYFLTETGVSIYTMKGEEKKTIELKKSKDGDALVFGTEDDSYNSTLIYTGTPKAEIGVLNIDDNKIEFYNKSTGLYTTEWQLPNDADLQKSFNFSYANEMVWLFDKSNRKWVVYK